MPFVSNHNVRDYLSSALWSSVDDACEPFDRRFDPSDFSLADRTAAKVDLEGFLTSVENAGLADVLDTPDAMDRWPHDLWLSRNGHGAGFFDRPEIYGGQANADKLQALAKAMGECDVYETEEGPRARLHALAVAPMPNLARTSKGGGLLVSEPPTKERENGHVSSGSD